MKTKTYTALIDYTEGENQIKEFATKAKALSFAREEIKWESTLHATVIEEDENGETEIFSQEGEQA
jgi:hypothetical protein